jgi:hypothetical protein
MGGPFNAIDYGVIALYLIGLLGIGLFLKKFASKGLEDYILARRQLPWWHSDFRAWPASWTWLARRLSLPFYSCLDHEGSTSNSGVGSV